MIKKYCLLIFGATLFFMNVKAQPIELAEVIQLSTINPAYTARSAATGGAFTSLGADVSSNFINPAGLGLYRSTEFTYGPNFSFKNSNSNYLSTKENESNFLFEFGTIGLTITSNKTWRNKRLKFINYGFAYHQSRNNNFNRSYSGLKKLSSYYFAELQDGFSVQQSETISTKGSKYSELALSIALNYNDRFFIGSNINFPRYTFNQEYRFLETDINGNLEDFNLVKRDESDYINSLSSTNIGIGILYKLTNYFRVGAYIKSSTIHLLSQDYILDEIEQYDDNTEEKTEDIFDENISYDLNEPFRANFGISYLNKKGFIAFDVEYRQNRNYFYSDDSSNETDNESYIYLQNSLIESDLLNTYNIKLGGEFKLKEDYRLRAGYQFITSPLKYVDELGHQHVASLGAGLRRVINQTETRQTIFFADVALLFATYKNQYLPYYFEDDLTFPIVEFNSIRMTLNSTFGIKF